jgi:hypothetical protein
MMVDSDRLSSKRQRSNAGVHQHWHAAKRIERLLGGGTRRRLDDWRLPRAGIDE